MERNMPAGLRYEEGLAAAILWRALADLRSGNPRLRRDAERFFAGAWCTDLLDFLNIPPELLSPALKEVEREY